MLFAAPASDGQWSVDDDRKLRQGYGLVEFTALCRVLARPEDDVRARVRVLRSRVYPGRPWSHSERTWFKKSYGSRTDEDLMVCMLRPMEEVRDQARQLCLAKDKAFRTREAAQKMQMPRWDDEAIRRLRTLYPTVANLELARLLSRSVASVANKANQLGLKKASDLLADIGRTNVNWRYLRAGERDEESGDGGDRASSAP
jgi:hypothetical protein